MQMPPILIMAMKLTLLYRGYVKAIDLEMYLKIIRMQALVLV